MRREDVFFNLDLLMKTDFFDRIKNKRTDNLKKEHVLKALRVEDEIYREVRENSGLLNEIERECIPKLPVADKLSRDIFQSFYSLNPRHNDDTELSVMVRKFNRYIVDEVMKSSEYPAIKTICEGRQHLSLQAAEQFMQRIEDNLDTLMDAADGGKNLLNTLQKLENRNADLSQKLKHILANGDTDEQLEKKKQKIAGSIISIENQIKAIDKLIDDNLKRSSMAASVIQSAVETARQEAEEIQAIMKSWGDEPGDICRDDLNAELVEKVRSNQALIDISKYLGRFREMLKQKRMNGFAYGRGEKYSIKLGNSLSNMLSSEFSLLACKETIPLFLKKYQKKSLKQYQKRDSICKGQGDIIVCLDESGSTEGDNAAWGKAVAFALLDIAKLNKKNFALIHFSGKKSYRTDLFLTDKYTRQDIFNAASFFLDGGTDYETPILEALLLTDGEDFNNADIVFITDGECRMSEDFAAEIKEKQEARSFTITGVLMDQDDAGMMFSLEPFCNEIYRISQIGGDRIIDELLSERTG